jgi:hypothetical protein
MKVAHIVPVSLLSLTRFNDYHLVLPHLMDNEEYAEFYRSEAYGHKILDNGIAEGIEFNWDQLVNIAHDIQAHEVVVPDYMGDCDRTIALADKFEPIARANPGLKYMGVIQGKSYSEIVKCFAYYELVADWVSVLAIPRVLANTIHKDIRWNFVNAFEDRIRERFEAVHFLGASSNIKEVLLLKDTIGRGIDTSMPAVMGLDNRMIDIDSYVIRQSGFFEAKPKQKQVICIEHNLHKYVEWAR